MPPAHSLTRKPSSNRVATENASRAHPEAGSPTGCAALVARKTSSRSPQSHRTYDGSLNWSPDHHQHPPLRVLRNRCGRQATASKQAPNGAYGNENLKKSRQPLRCHNRRFLQQNPP